MRMKHIIHKGVKPDGTFEDKTKGAVLTTGTTFIGFNRRRQRMIVAISPRTKSGEVHVIHAIFSKAEWQERIAESILHEQIVKQVTGALPRKKIKF